MKDCNKYGVEQIYYRTFTSSYIVDCQGPKISFHGFWENRDMYTYIKATFISVCIDFSTISDLTCNR